MSKDWTQEELQVASQVMKSSGNMSYEEFCEAMGNGYFVNMGPHADQGEDSEAE